MITGSEPEEQDSPDRPDADGHDEQHAAEIDPLVDRARRLFRFLAESQRLRTKPVHTVENYEWVRWTSEIPHHPAISLAGRDSTPDGDDHVLSVARLPHRPAPAPSTALAEWLDTPGDAPERAPQLHRSIPDGTRPQQERDSEQTGPERLHLDDHPEISRAYDEWIEQWRSWAERELSERPVRGLYNELFTTYTELGNNPESLELVLGLGCLSWQPNNGSSIKRHLLTTAADIRLDDSSGTITLTRSNENVENFTLERDMLAPELITDASKLNELSSEAARITTHPLDRAEPADVIRRFVHTLDADGQYHDEDTPSQAQPYPVATFAPAIVLRKRSQRGIVRIFDSITEQLAENGTVPAGVRPLVDPDQQPSASDDRTATKQRETIDEETFLPLPVNEKQLRVVQHADTEPQTLVQGPPGTGKTHTTAALLAHLLAQGKRVLVTAHTDRALQEVRDKLPDEIKPLSVAVVGTSRQDMSDLRVAVDNIADNAHEHDGDRTAEIVAECSNRIDEARRERARLHHQLIEAHRHEHEEHSVAGYHGTLSEIARQHTAEAERHEWLAEFVTASSDSTPPLGNTEIGEWYGALFDRETSAEEPWARQRLLEPAELTAPEKFADLVDAEAQARDHERQYDELKEHTAFDAVSALDHATRETLRGRLHELADTADELAHRRETWMSAALDDVLAGRSDLWRSRADKLEELVNRCATALNQLDQLTEVRATGDVSALVNLANGVLEQLRKGARIKIRADGTPKLGLFTAKWIKHAAPLFDQVRVDGTPPTTVEQLSAFLHWVEADRTLAALDRTWPEDVVIPAEDTLRERLDWHITEHKQLGRVLELGGELETEQQRLARAGLPQPDWNDLAAVRRYAALVDAAGAVEARTTASAPLDELDKHLEETTRWTDTGECVHGLLEAVRARDHETYAAHHRRLLHLLEARRRVRRREELEQRLEEAAPRLRAAIEAEPEDSRWAERLADFERAWSWLAVRSWVLEQHTTDENELQARINSLENVIREQNERLCATRAWSHAVDPERLGGNARADLRQYSNLVRRLGKGTGTHAERRRADIRDAMMRCRPSVPVWIMPIYRIAEQFRIRPDMFDVVVVDEASQAGLEAIFLQYMAPRMVVIGDDKQVSPMGVGLNQDELRKLAGQYIADDPYRASWEDPQHSLFDDAKMRYGGQITLTEHRRCVPEIIEFSNRIAYRPDNIPLSPVRQYDADRLEPFRARHVTEGYRTGKSNEPEAEAVVAEIVRCLDDPRYAGRTFGVVSLMGDDQQARLIERKLLERISPQEMESHRLRCGTPPDFQGAERDVVFLSMVEARRADKRMSSLTGLQHVQRYNVAVSRAKDQVWLFHSVSLSELHNREDMRFQLLEHCYGMIDGSARTDSGELVGTVSEDQRDTVFDSLFEQRVFNRLVTRGYSVIPQYPVGPYRIDLVVIGSKARMAVECDGDAWHGPEAYERDLARQRELERCGWTFHRIRESSFHVDQGRELETLWKALHEQGIHPRGAEPETVDQAVEETVEAALADAAPVVEPDTAPAEPSTPETTPDAGTETRRTETDDTANSPVVVDAPAVVNSGGQVAEHASTADGVEPEPRAEDPELTDEGVVSEHADHVEHSGALPHPQSLTREQLAEGMREIVAVEGPVLGDRLGKLYARAYGGRRTKEITKALHAAISTAVDNDMLVQDTPLGESEIKDRTFRLPEQPPVHVRTAGPRSIDEIPPRELATVLAQQARQHGWQDEKRLFRAVLHRFGWRQLSTKAQQRLRTIKPLVAEEEV
ncbi:very-short-patch-repair endonuclease [Actinopolyspora biskrensis]|uniref:Very-short-patch-repair endonuclease n=1 Tax=Actinopolyspora biskrensis TaxID=1470178 RepID=A0A852YV53_9ACTN|nr:AAA domain-containing protein [Actinopolyspora biskrensis]NYH77612.1 very-short-patch-repair endonuclease [Actinopolyspora biskrensis]